VNEAVMVEKVQWYQWNSRMATQYLTIALVKVKLHYSNQRSNECANYH